MEKKIEGYAIVFLIGLVLVSPFLALEFFVDNWVWYAVIAGFIAIPAAFFVWLVVRVMRGLKR